MRPLLPQVPVWEGRYIPPLPTSIPYSSISLASDVPQASPLLASSLIFSGSFKVNCLGRGVFSSASQTALAITCEKESAVDIAAWVGSCPGSLCRSIVTAWHEMDDCDFEELDDAGTGFSGAARETDRQATLWCVAAGGECGPPQF
jgi:hypothetical protein